MLNLTDEQKALFKESGHFPGYIFSFADIDLVITNETIHDQAVTVKESIMDANELTLGGCIASSIEFEVSEIMANDITGHEFTAKIEVTDADDNVELSNLPMGTYTPTTVQQVDDKDYKKVTAYDRLTRATADVSEWYNTWFGDGDTHTVKETRESLLTYLGIPYVVQNLTNDTYVCEKTVESAQMIGLDILKMICAINGGFGRMNRSGQFEVITLAEITGSEPDTSEDYRTVKYEEYTSEAVTGIIVKGTTDDVGIDVGDKDTNPYIITGNIFLYNNDTDEQKTAIRTVATNILNLIKNITYRPHTSNIDGLPYMECGDVFKIEKENDTLESYIFSRTLSGVAYLQDQYEAKGTQERKNEVSATSEMYRNAGKQFVFVTSVDGLKAELTNFETDTTTSIELLDGKIESKVSTEDMESSIEQSADQIKSTVGTAQNKYQEPQAGGDIALKLESTIKLEGGIIDICTTPYTNGTYDMTAIGSSGKVLLRHSDTLQWEVKSNTYGKQLTEIAWNDDSKMAIAVGGQNNYNFPLVYRTSDGMSWSVNSYTDYDYNNLDEFEAVSVCYGNGRYVMLTDNTGIGVIWSADGKTWGGSYNDEASGYPMGDKIRYLNGEYIVVSMKRLYHISDLVTPSGDYNEKWTEEQWSDETVNELGYSVTLIGKDIAYGNRVYILAVLEAYYDGTGYKQRGRLYKSGNLKDWSVYAKFDNSSGDNGMMQVKFVEISEGNGLFVATAQDGSVWWFDGAGDYAENGFRVADASSMENGLDYLGNRVYAGADGIYGFLADYSEPPRYKIELYGYGSPDGNAYYEKDGNAKKYYLDQETGNVYQLDSKTGDAFHWTFIETLDKITDNLQSEITQTNSQIVLKVNSETGEIVSVDLGIDPEEGSHVDIIADRIRLSGSELIELLSDGALNLTGKNITIESDNFNVDTEGKVTANSLEMINGTITSPNFNVDSEGNVTANALTITGGQFDVYTNYSNVNILKLKGISGLEYVTITKSGALKSTPDIAGIGIPTTSLITSSDINYYYDISSYTVWEAQNGMWVRMSADEFDSSESSKVTLKEIDITSSDGVTIKDIGYMKNADTIERYENYTEYKSKEFNFRVNEIFRGISYEDECSVSFTLHPTDDPIPSARGVMKLNRDLYVDAIHTNTVNTTNLKIGNKQLVTGTTSISKAGEYTSTVYLTVNNSIALDMPATVCESVPATGAREHMPYGVVISAPAYTPEGQLVANAYIRFELKEAIGTESPDTADSTQINYSYWITV